MLVHRRVTPSSTFACTHLYTWVERGTVRVKVSRPRTQHSALARAWTQPFDSESSKLTIRPPRLPRLPCLLLICLLSKVKPVKYLHQRDRADCLYNGGAGIIEIERLWILFPWGYVKCPLYKGVHVMEASKRRGSTVTFVSFICLVEKCQTL